MRFAIHRAEYLRFNLSDSDVDVFNPTGPNKNAGQRPSDQLNEFDDWLVHRGKGRRA